MAISNNESGSSVRTKINASLALTDAITASAAELNILDGATLSVTELNHVDGVTSAIQTQLDAKASSTALSTEASTRATDDTTLAGLITTEASTRSTADNTLQTNIDNKVTKNANITPATKTKVTYDAKGLVTSGADATTADIADSTNKRYVTDADLADIGNLSGTNSGDNAVNSLYSGLVSNATHTGDVTGATALTIAAGAVTEAKMTLADNTTNNASATKHGFLKKLSNVATEYMDGTGAWSVPSGGGGGSSIEILTATIGTTQNDYAISGISTDKNVLSVLRITPSASFKITGISATGIDDGKRVRIYNNSDPLTAGSMIILAERNSTSSLSANRLLSPIYGSFPPIITPGQYLDFELNTTVGSWTLVSASDWGNPNGYFDTYSDCHVNAPFLTNTATAGSIGATSSSTLSNTVQKTVGTMLHTLTTNAGRAYLGTQNGAMYLGTGSALGMARVAFGALADATDDYFSCNLFTDAMGGSSPVDQAGWVYNRATSTDWRTSTASNSTETANTVSGFTPSTTIAHTIGVFVNGDATRVDFFYSADGDTWTFATSHTTNIPSGTSRVLGFSTGFTKTAGNGSKTMVTDWLGFKLMTKRGV